MRLLRIIHRRSMIMKDNVLTFTILSRRFLTCLLLFALAGMPLLAQAGTQTDGDFTIELSEDTIYLNEDVTITITHAGGEQIKSIQLITKDGKIVAAPGNTITISRDQIIGTSTLTSKDVGIGAKLRVGTNSTPMAVGFYVRVEDVARPSTQTPKTYNPTVSLGAIQQLGDIKDLKYRFNTVVSADGCTLTGLHWSATGVSGPLSTSKATADFKFPQTGDYTIEVVAEFEDPEGNYHSDVDSVIFFAGINQPPTAKLYVLGVKEPATYTSDKATGMAPLEATFTAQFSTDPEGDPLVEYRWYFDDSATHMTTTTPTATHTFTDVGLQEVHVVVVDDLGNESQLSNAVLVEVTLEKPKLIITHRQAGPAPDTVDFKVYAPFEKDATSMSFNWNFGDGQQRLVDTGSSISHTYSKLGPYTVTVECRYDYPDGSYQVMTLTQPFQVQGPIKAVFKAAQIGAPPGVPKMNQQAIPVGTQFSFSGARSTSQYGKIVQYELDLDGDGTYEHVLDKPAISHVCSNAGQFTARLRVTDEHGNQAETTLSYGVIPGITAMLSVTPANATAPAEITCDAGGSTCISGSIDHYIWEISNDQGARSTDQTSGPVIKVTFPSTGVYSITVRACDALNNESPPVTRTVLLGDLPVPDIDYSKPVYAGNSITFSAAASTSPNGKIMFFEWDLHGNGFASDNGAALQDEGPSVTTTFSQTGQHTIRVRVTDELGFSNTLSINVDVETPPVINDPFGFGRKGYVPTG